MIEPTAAPGDTSAWVAAFHAGSRATMHDLYQDYFATVDSAVGRVLAGADK